MLGGLNCRALIVCYAPRRASATSPRLTSAAHYLPVVSVTSCATKSDSELLIICDVASRSTETNINSLFLFFLPHIHPRTLIIVESKKEDQRERGGYGFEGCD